MRHVLIFYEGGSYYPLPDLVDKGIRSALEKSDYRVEFYREYMETALFPDPGEQQRFRDFYVRKYQDHKPDLIIAVGPSPLEFLVKTHRTSFPGVPVVFCLPNRLPGGFTIDSDFTGVEGDIAPAATLEAALRLQPGTRHVVVVGGTSPFDTQQNAAIKEQLRAYENGLDISYLTDLAMPGLLERLKRLPPHTVILLGGLGRDAAGTHFTTAQSAPMVLAAANAPVFSLNDRDLNHGEVGGDVSNADQQGNLAGAMALQILKGEKPRNVPALKDVTTYIFDWRALQRWGLRESRLPPGSIILNRPPSAWQLYKRYVLASVVVLSAQSLAIFALLWQRARRRRTEAELRESRNQLKGIVESAMDAVITIDESQRIVVFNAAAEKMFGCPAGEAIGSPVDRFIPERFHIAHRAHIRRFADTGTTARALKTIGPLWGLRSSGEEFPIEASLSQSEAGGRKLFTVIIRDITERKQAEDALSTVNQKLIEAQEKERARIARELHDDINQRLALLAVNLERLKHNPPTSRTELRQAIAKTHKQVEDLGSDIQTISHRLHSSKLEYLGLGAAAAAFCRELSAQHAVKIDFFAENVSKVLPEGISLCVFRILQEALQNAIKYSGTKSFQVSLRERSDEIELTVRDSGTGFDPAEVVKGDGLGLASMKERLKLVNGTLSIHSQLHLGTTIQARAPLAPGSRSAAG